jgi:hypothetical protein
MNAPTIMGHAPLNSMMIWQKNRGRPENIFHLFWLFFDVRTRITLIWCGLHRKTGPKKIVLENLR